MPIEIRELHIKIIADGEEKKAKVADKVSAKEKQEIIRECIEQVMEVLQQNKER
ncbi:DUF5908 family protein [Cytophagaceae bacterium ABcell3]|nr:DUF5908 family protein [Cytophagaceae bacterium ABcell3]